MTPGPQAPRRHRRAAALAAAALLLGGGASMLHLSARSSPTWDEVNAYGLGAWYLETGRFDLPGAYHPPLAAYLAALPLDTGRAVAAGAFDPLRPDQPPAARMDNDVERGNILLQRLGLEQFLRTRLPFIAVYLALGGLVFLWSSRWFGPEGGLFSLALFLLCPNLAAHGFTATTDLLAAALAFAALACLFLAFEAPGPGPLAGFLAFLALAPAAKLLGLLAAPAAALAVLGRGLSGGALAIWLPGRGRRAVGRRAFLAYFVGVGAVGLLACWAALAAAYQGELDLRTFRQTLQAVGGQLERGFPVFLDGQVSRHGFLAFYAKAIPYKTSLAVLAAWALSGLAGGPPRRAGWGAVVAAALGVVLLLSLSRFTVGLRYALLAFPLLHLAAGRLAAVADRPRREARLRLGLCAALAAVALVEQAAVHPYPRAYLNRALVAGPGHLTLADSDLDWGEGLPALRDFIQQRGLDQVALSYHGAAWPHLFGIRPAWYENPLLEGGAPRPPPRSGWLFVSSTNLSGLFFPDDRYRWLRHQAPDAIVGGTIYGFDLDRLAAGRPVRSP
jgi:4-amino-4-deoxy-L-arabinose transferase-like glycosyltransferase